MRKKNNEKGKQNLNISQEYYSSNCQQKYDFRSESGEQLQCEHYQDLDITNQETYLLLSNQVLYAKSFSLSRSNSQSNVTKKLSIQLGNKQKQDILNQSNFSCHNDSSLNRTNNNQSIGIQIGKNIKLLNKRKLMIKNSGIQDIQGIQCIRGQMQIQSKTAQIINNLFNVKTVDLQYSKLQKICLTELELIHIFKSLDRSVRLMLIYDLLHHLSFSKCQQTQVRQDYFICFQPNEFKFIPSIDIDSKELVTTLLSLCIPQCRLITSQLQKTQNQTDSSNSQYYNLKQFHNIINQDLNKIKRNQKFLNNDNLLQNIGMRYILDKQMSSNYNIDLVKLLFIYYLEKINLVKLTQVYKDKIIKFSHSYNLPISYCQSQQRFINKRQLKVKKLKMSKENQKLNLSSFAGISSIAAIQHFEQLDRIKNLINLKYHPFLCVMSYPDITRQQMIKYFNQYQHFPCFNLKQSYLPDLNIKNVLKQIDQKTWKQITSLDCGNCPIQNSGLQEILKYNWDHLKSLDLWRSGITTLANTTLYQIKNLVYFSASYNQFKMDTLDYLIEHKQSWKKVKDFRISFSNGDKVWAKFVKHQKQTFPSLKYLGVRNYHLLKPQTLDLIRSLKEKEIQMNI